MKTALVLGGGGFIGSHLVKRLKEEGYYVRAVDLKKPEFWKTAADDFIIGDLRWSHICSAAFRPLEEKRRFDEVYQLAADMGGAGYLFTGDSDADIMHNSALINLNVLRECVLEEHAPKKYSMQVAPVCIQSTINWTQKAQNVQKTVYILLNLTLNMDGKNCLVKECIWLLQEIKT